MDLAEFVDIVQTLDQHNIRATSHFLPVHPSWAVAMSVWAGELPTERGVELLGDADLLDDMLAFLDWFAERVD